MAALDEVFAQNNNDDRYMRSLWMRILPIYFKHYDPLIGKAMDEVTSYSAAAWNQAITNCLPKFNTLSRIKEITVPTLILGGADDWLTPIEQSRRMHAELPNSEIVTFEDSGHFLYIEETNKFIATVRNWLAKL